MKNYNLYYITHSKFSWFFIGNPKLIKEYINLTSFIEKVTYSLVIENLNETVVNYLYDFLEDKIITEINNLQEKLISLVEFVSDFQILDENIDLGIEMCTNDNILLVYSKKFYKAFVYKKNELTEKTIEMSFDLIIIKSYTNSNFEKLEQFFKEKSFYESAEILFDKITLFENLYDIGYDTDQSIVERYISDNYDITKNSKDRVKVNLINQNLIQNLGKSKKDIIPKLLENLGIEKKRYTDGFSYVGIKRLDLQSTIQRREKESEEFILTFN